jgi:small multidrug resistance family-3 protein
MTRTILVFIIASIFEISGCYFIWQWLKNNKGIELGIVGIVLLTAYGVIATLQTGNFAKVYVVYGGVFILTSIIWSYYFDRYRPDKLDTLGFIFMAVGIILIYFVPRK